MIKRIYTLVLLVVLLGTQSISAQKKVRESINFGEGSKRHEIAIPQVNGYNVYKADLHVHTLYSDGGMLPSARVDEAWHDGLDIIAITDHYEIRKYEQRFLDFLYGYFGGKAPNAKNNRITVKNPADKDGIMVDMNQPVREAQERAKLYGMLVIPGTEISRESTQQGHFNVLFAKDYNKLYDIDIEKCFAKAREQGALIIHNHPGWNHTTTDKSEWQKQMYAKKWFDGVEVANGGSFGPKLVRRCIDENLIVLGGSDIHGTACEKYSGNGLNRTMTLIFAKDLTLESVREAMDNRRTLAYIAGHIIGKEELLRDLFKASVEVKRDVDWVDKKKQNITYYSITNRSSLSFTIGKRQIKPHETIRTSVRNGKKLRFTVQNMWHMDGKKLVMTY
ncbi:MAG: PHP domain-containing protein [Alistipes sp.]|nr:PHP domain-containing protein [Alistipes sp.]